MKNLLVSFLLSIVCGNVFAQQLVPLDLQPQTENWAHAIDYKDGRLVLGGQGDFPSMVIGTISSSMILVSDDLGDNSVRRAVDEMYSNVFRRVWKVEMLSSNVILIAGVYANTLQRVIWRSEDGGVSWNEVWLDQDGTSPRWIYDIECSGNDCMAVGSSNKILWSTNAGVTWSELTPNVQTEDFYEVVTTNGTDWYISSENELLHYSEQGGFVTRFDHAQETRRVSLTAQNNLLLTADEGVIYTSSNAGFDWDSVRAPVNDYIIDAWSDDQGNIYAAEYNGRLFYSDSDGAYWYEYDHPVQDSYFGDIHVDPGTGYAFIASEDEAYRIETGWDSWLPVPTLVDLPDTLCVDNTYQLTVAGDPNWDYVWIIDGQQVATGFTPTISFDPATTIPIITCEVTYQGQINTVQFGGFTLIPSNYLPIEPYLVEDTVCYREWTELVLPANPGVTTYEVYDGNTLIEGPITVEFQDEQVDIRLYDYNNIEVRALRSNSCGTLTTPVDIQYHVLIPAVASDFVFPEWVCNGDDPIVTVNTNDGVFYELQQNNLNYDFEGDGSVMEIQVHDFDGSSYIYLDEVSMEGCWVTSNIVGATMYEDTVRACFVIENSTVIDTMVNLNECADGHHFEWQLPGSDIGVSSSELPEFSYPQVGYYPLLLISSTDNGCVDSTMNYVTVNQQMDEMTLDTCSADTFYVVSGTGAAFWDRYSYETIADRIVREDGSIIVGGSYRGTGAAYGNGNIAPNMFLQKLDASGNSVWELVQLGQGGGDYYFSTITGVSEDPNGNLYVSGTVSDQDGYFDPFGNTDFRVFPGSAPLGSSSHWGFVMKVNDVGEIQWFELTQLEVNDYSRATDILYQNDERIIVCTVGAHESGPPENNLLIFNSFGELVNSVPFANRTRPSFNAGAGENQLNCTNSITTSGTYSGMMFPYAPKIQMLESGQIMLKVFASDELEYNGGIEFGGDTLNGRGLINAFLEPDLTWSNATFVLEGEVRTGGGFSRSHLSIPEMEYDENGNGYMAFNFFGDFSIGGQSFSYGSNGSVIAKLDASNSLVWIHVDTVLEYQGDFTQTVYLGSQSYIDLAYLDNSLYLVGWYNRSARFTATNGVFAQYKPEPDRSGSFLNKYDLDGNLVWSKNIPNHNNDLIHSITKNEACGNLEIYSQWTETVPDPLFVEDQTRVTYTAMSENCSSQEPCESRSVQILSADQQNCSEDTTFLRAMPVGIFDSLRWHVYQNGQFEPLLGSSEYSGETTDTLHVFAASSTMAGNVFRLTGYHSAGNLVSSGVVQLLPYPEYDEVLSITQGTCPILRIKENHFYPIDSVQILLDGIYIATVTSAVEYQMDVLQSHTLQFREWTECGYVYSDEISIEPNQAEIVQQPVDVYIDENSSLAIFEVEGLNIESYQWQESIDQINWEDLQDVFFALTGSETDNLSILSSSQLTLRTGRYYRCILTNQINCEAITDTVQLISTTGIAEGRFSFGLMPNPSTGTFVVFPSTADQYVFSLHDMLGRVLMQEKIQGKTSIDATHLASGTYLIRLRSVDGLVVGRRFVIQKE